MKGFQYISYLTYTYDRPIDEIKMILQQDGYQEYNIVEESNQIQYKINNERVVRLDNLLYLFRINYVKITTAQLLQLCLEIIQKYQLLSQNSIKHNYLDLNRVLLKLQDYCPSISIMPQLYYYTIHFTGYGCPFYEKQNQIDHNKTDQDAIKDIVQQILQYTQPNKDKKKEKQILNISELKAQIQISFDSFINNIQNIFQKYNNKNNQFQILHKIDGQFSDLNYKRNNRGEDVQKNLRNLRNNYYNKNQNWYLYEQCLYQTIPLITKEFRKGIYYTQQKQPQDIKLFDFKQQLEYFDQKQIDEILDQNIADCSQYYKFDWNKPIIKQDIDIILHKELIILQYFLNDINFSKKENIIIEKQIDQLKKTIIIQVVNQAFQMYLKLMYLQLIHELI